MQFKLSRRLCPGALPSYAVLAVLAWGVLWGVASQAPAQDVPPDDPMLSYLRGRVAQDPQHADSWRLIGRLERKRGNVPGAIGAVSHALQLDPNMPAAHFDLGELMELVGDQAAAETHFRSVAAIAPESEYAQSLYRSGKAMRATPPVALPVGPAALSSEGIPGLPRGEEGLIDGGVEQVRYEIQTFDGNDDLNDRFAQLESEVDPELQSVRFFLETGALYNSNVTLTPISRELANADAASFQAFASPDLEWVALRRGAWRGGTIARGYFTMNESTFSNFDLSSFQPGAFLERDFQWNATELIGRIEYLYALDLFGGNRFGDRHSITASVLAIDSDLDATYSYIRTSISQFADDGPTPQVTSLDGPAITAGVSRFLQTEWEWMPTYTLGVDIDSANTVGEDYRYRALNGFVDSTFRLSERWSLIPTAGVGHRDYYSFTGPVSRDEWTWRVHAKLRWQATDRVAVSAVVGHDRFASKNDAFDAERTQGGIITTILY